MWFWGILLLSAVQGPVLMPPSAGAETTNPPTALSAPTILPCRYDSEGRVLSTQPSVWPTVINGDFSFSIPEVVSSPRDLLTELISTPTQASDDITSFVDELQQIPPQQTKIFWLRPRNDCLIDCVLRIRSSSDTLTQAYCVSVKIDGTLEPSIRVGNPGDSPAVSSPLINSDAPTTAIPLTAHSENGESSAGICGALRGDSAAGSPILTALIFTFLIGLVWIRRRNLAP